MNRSPHGYLSSLSTIGTDRAFLCHGAQMRRLRQELKVQHLEGYDVTTVDRFQGDENDIIILSLVRSNSKALVFWIERIGFVCPSVVIAMPCSFSETWKLSLHVVSSLLAFIDGER